MNIDFKWQIKHYAAMKADLKKPLPADLYSAESVRRLDSIAINEFDIPGYELMKRAGQAVFDYLQQHFPLARQILVCCGAGNNAGDGYVVARLAMQAGFRVQLISMLPGEKLQGDARQAWQDWRSLGHQPLAFSADLPAQADIIIDALLGTGLQRDIEGEWAELVNAINRSGRPVIAVDIPSGLCADTGRIAGCGVRASATVTFIGLKKGLLTHYGVDHCGELIFDDLGIPEGVYSRQPPQARRLDWGDLSQQIRPRKASSHKHQHGHLLVLGGDLGMPGAVRMAAEAALRAGAGLVTVISHAEHSEAILAGRPELMLQPSAEGHIPRSLLARADALVIGPGLTDSPWSQQLLATALQADMPRLIDAGALRLLDEQDASNDNSHQVLTPHAGEAAALLGESPALIQDSRFSSVELLQQKYGGHIVLKGAGTLIQSPKELTWLCPYGNPGMATAGMGDILSGVIGALLAQKYPPAQAARLGVCLHSLGADQAARDGQIGLLATDLLPFIRQLINSHD